MKFIMYNKNGCGQGYSLSIGAWDVGVVIMVPRNHFQKLRPMTYVHVEESTLRACTYVHIIHTCGGEHITCMYVHTYLHVEEST